MIRKYVWKRGDEFTQPHSLTMFMAAAHGRMITGHGPFSLIAEDKKLVSNKRERRVASVLKSAVQNKEIGTTFRIRKGNGDVVFCGRAVRVDIVSDANSTNGNEHADVYYNFIMAHCRDLKPRFAGSYVCKTIVGSGGTMSQHSYGNADDFFFASLSAQDKAAAIVVQNADALHIAHLISRDRIWEPGTGWHSYSGEYHSHLHADFLPQYSGGCGVKGPM